MRLEGVSPFKVAVEHEAQMGSAVQQQSTKVASPSTDQKSVRSYRSNDTEESDTLWAFLDRVFIIKDLYESTEE